MPDTVSHYKSEVLNEMEGLSVEKLREVLRFVCFIKVKEVIDPPQSYYWTKEWQQMENEADRDKEAGNVIGDGTLENLLDELKK